MDSGTLVNFTSHLSGRLVESAKWSGKPQEARPTILETIISVLSGVQLSFKILESENTYSRTCTPGRAKVRRVFGPA